MGDILDAITSRKSNRRYTYLAKLDINGNIRECKVKCAIYETSDKIGVVSDWSKEDL